MYTPHLWWNYKKMYVTKLQITYHNILKRNIGLSKYESTSATCAFTNTQCSQSTIRNLVFKCVCRLNKSDNALIKALLASSVAYSSRIHSHWRRLLYVHGASQKNEGKCTKRHFANSCQLRGCAQMRAKYRISTHAITLYKM